MKRTTITLPFLLLFMLCAKLSFAQITSFSPTQAIIIFNPSASQTEINNLLTEYNMQVIDGPTPVTKAYLVQAIGGVFPPWAYTYDPVNPINGVVETGKASEEIDAIGLKYLTDQPSNGGQPTPGYTNPLQFCNASSFSINTTELGNSNIKAGVFDTGIGMTSLFEPYFEGPQELGLNFVNPNLEPIDDHGHGSHMTSLLVNNIPNNTNVISLNTYKTHDESGYGSIWNTIQAIDQSVLNNFKVVNMSFSFRADYHHRFDAHAPISVAIENARQISGTLFIASAGNNGSTNDDPYGLANYPSSYLNDNILSVAAIECNTDLAQWSNFGGLSVDIAAPGVNILGLDHEGLWMTQSGTSPATALVSRVALLLGTHQDFFDYQEIKCAIINGATSSLGLQDKVQSGGYLDALSAQDELFSGTECGDDDEAFGFKSSNQSTSTFLEMQNDKTINIKSNQEQIVYINIFNVLGQIIHSKKQIVVEGENLFDLEKQNLIPNTVYFVSAMIGNKMETLKIMYK